MTNLYKSVPIRSSEITSKHDYLSRRDFMKAATLATGAALLAACAPSAADAPQNAQPAPESAGQIQLLPDTAAWQQTYCC